MGFRIGSATLTVSEGSFTGIFTRIPVLTSDAPVVLPLLTRGAPHRLESLSVSDGAGGSPVIFASICNRIARVRDCGTANAPGGGCSG